MRRTVPPSAEIQAEIDNLLGRGMVDDRRRCCLSLVIGGFVRGLSMRDVESLCEEAGLGKTSKSTVATICAELHERFEAFCRRSLYDVNLVVLFLDAIYTSRSAGAVRRKA